MFNLEQLFNKPRHISIILLCVMFQYLQADGFLRRQGNKIIDGSGQEVILRGMGLGGWMLQEGYMMQTSSFANAQFQLKKKIEELVDRENMELFYDAWLNNHVQKVDIDSLASWGFNSVRLPLHYNLYTLPIEEEPVTGFNTWLDRGFMLTDNLLSWCAENKMYLILDLHAAPGGQGYDAPISDYDETKPSLWESEYNRAKTVALWQKLAERYAGESWIGGYDLINETNWDLPGNSMLRSLYEEITEAIRQVDTNHILFIEGNWFANDFNGLTPPWDDNMVYSFHKYWSYNDRSSIEWMLNIRNSYNVPIWCGESGENSNVWFTDAIGLLEKYKIGWAWWPLKKIESISGPLSIKKSEGYQRLLDYWEGNAIRPSLEFSVDALMELAENAKLGNCIFHKDVIDAMIRQPHSDERIPFNKNTIPGILFATDYDLGKYNFAYWDTETANYHVSSGTYTTWNNGWAYRNDGVDIESCEDNEITNGFNVGWTAQNEWLMYTIHVSQADSFDVSIRVACDAGNGAILLIMDGQPVIPITSLPATGGWQTWQTVFLGNIYLESGKHDLRLKITNEEFNMNYLEFKALNKIGSTDDYKSKAIYLFQNYPNPVLNSTTVQYWLKEVAKVTLALYNIKGQKIKNLYTGTPTENLNDVVLNKLTNGFSNGVYLLQLKSGGHQTTRKLIILH